MILYHGSNMAIEKIDLTKSKPNKDFGQGFYLSDNEAQAMEMALFKTSLLGDDPVVTRFEFDERCLHDTNLKVKIFEGYSEEWAKYVFDNRNGNYAEQYDIVYGPIANDKVGLQIRKLKDGSIDIMEFMRRLKYMKGITYQYFFGTECAIAKLIKID